MQKKKRMYNFSTLQNVRMQYELCEELHGPERTKAAALTSQPAREIQTRFLSLRSAWERWNLGPGVVGMVISELDPTLLAYCLCL